MSGDTPSSRAERLDWLFTVFRPALPDVSPDAGQQPIPRTEEEVGALLNDASATGTADTWTATVRQLRKGRIDDYDTAVTVAATFGAPAALLSDDRAEADKAQGNLLAHALREHGIREYRVCRNTLDSASLRAQLWKVLSTFGPAPGQPPDDPPGSASSAASIPHPASPPSPGTLGPQPLSRDQIRTLCQQLVADLGLKPPFSPDELCRRLAKHRGRRIKLRTRDLGATTSLGHLVAHHRYDRIIRDSNAPLPQQRIVTYHEIMHLVRKHLQGDEALTCGALLTGPDDEDTGEPGLYSDWKEWEAETGATELAALGRRRQRPSQLPTSVGNAEQELATAFGFWGGAR